MGKSLKAKLYGLNDVISFTKDLCEKDTPFNDLVPQVFHLLGNVLHIDMILLNIFQNDNQGFINKYCWQGPMLQKKKYVLTKSISTNVALFNFFDEVDYLCVNDTRKLNDHLVAFKGIYRMLHIKSIMVFPLKMNQVTVGSIVLTSNLKRKHFTSNEIQEITEICKLIEKRFVKEYYLIMVEIHKQHYKDLLVNMIYPTVILDNEFKIINANEAFYSFFNTVPTELVKTDFVDFIGNYDQEAILNVLNRGKNFEIVDYEFFKMIKDKKKMVRLVPFPLVNQELELLTILFKDITEYKVKGTKIQRMAHFDLKTELYNKNYFDETVRELSMINNLNLGILVIDIDHLKLINYQYGRDKGDELIKQIGKLLKLTFDHEYLVARTDGDEFTIIFINKNEEYIQKQLSSFLELYQHNISNHEISVAYAYSNGTYSIEHLLIKVNETILHQKHKEVALEALKKEGIYKKY